MSNVDKDIENIDLTLAVKIDFVLSFISDEIKQNGEISLFKEDVMYIIHTLLEKQLTSKELTACEIVMKRNEYEIQKAKENKLEGYISELKSDLETWQKIADLMARQINNYDAQLVIDRFRSKEEVLEWAKSEVLKNE